MFSQLFDSVLYNPILNLLVYLYNHLPGNDLGVVIIVVTLIIKLLLYPLTHSSIKSQKSLQELQPKIQALKTQYKNDAQKMTQETMKLYKENKVNPFSSCLPLLVQLPILLALYFVLQDGLKELDASRLYSFVQAPASINMLSVGFLELAKPSIVVALLAGVAQFFQTKMFYQQQTPATDGAKDEHMLVAMNKTMLYAMPVMTVLIGAGIQSALTLYWLVSTVVTFVQQVIVFKHVERSKPSA